MADRRLLEDGSIRLQEDGSSRLLEQQSELFATLAVTDGDDTLVATAELTPLQAQPAAGAPATRRRVRKPPQLRIVEEIELRRIAARLTISEDDDVLHAQVDVLTGLRARRNNDAIVLLMAA